MKIKNIVALLGVFSVCLSAAQSTAQAAENSALRDEFNAQARHYEQLFKAGDAEGLAKEWTENGSLQTFDGHVCKGREELTAYFKRNFTHFGTPKVAVNVGSLQEPAPGVVIEEGTTTVGDMPSPTSKYTALHVKGGDGWKMAWVTETALARGAISSIKDMSWLAGKWKADTKQNIVMQAKWIESENFLECTTYDDERKTEVRQIIGYNPQLNTLVSWHFTPNGGFGRGQWAKVSDGWRQESSGLLPNGVTTTATYTLKPRSKTSFTWQSTERFIGGVSIPDSGVLVLNRVEE